MFGREGEREARGVARAGTRRFLHLLADLARVCVKVPLRALTPGSNDLVATALKHECCVSK